MHKALRSFSDLPFQLPDDTPNESEATTTTTINTDNDVSNINSTSSIEYNNPKEGIAIATKINDGIIVQIISIAVLCVNLNEDNSLTILNSLLVYFVLSGRIHQKENNILYILYTTKIKTTVKKKNT